MCVCGAGEEGVSKHVGVGGLEVVHVVLQAAVGAVRLLQLLLQLLQTPLHAPLHLVGGGITIHRLSECTVCACAMMMK